MTPPEDRIRQDRLRFLRGEQTPRVYDPGPLPPELLQKQEVMANGAYCGHILQSLAEAPHGDGHVRYPLDYFGEDEDPILTPDTEANRSSNTVKLPILAWTLSADRERAYVVVDMLEKDKYPVIYLGGVYQDVRHPDIPPPLTNCKVATGRPSEILPRRILEKMGLS